MRVVIAEDNYLVREGTRRASTGRWEPDAELVAAIRAYVPQFAMTEHAWLEVGPSGELVADDAHIYGHELYDAASPAAIDVGRSWRTTSGSFRTSQSRPA